MRCESVTVKSPGYRIGISSAVVAGGLPYSGEYKVTPKRTRQTLETEGCTLAKDITIEPIPSNYGLISWNGAFLRVS